MILSQFRSYSYQVVFIDLLSFNSLDKTYLYGKKWYRVPPGTLGEGGFLREEVSRGRLRNLFLAPLIHEWENGAFSCALLLVDQKPISWSKAPTQRMKIKELESSGSLTDNNKEFLKKSLKFQSIFNFFKL